MKKAIWFLFLAVMSLQISCKKDADSDFSNELKFGTGLAGNGFDLAGIGSTFNAGTLIYFRFESEEDMAGRKVVLDVLNQSGTVYNTYQFPNPQSYGHIFLSSFFIQDPGAYTVKARLGDSGVAIVTAGITVQ
jgi:hypothetical protein